MTATNPPLTLDAVLDLFQMEEVHDGDVLGRYVAPVFAPRELTALRFAFGLLGAGAVVAVTHSSLDVAAEWRLRLVALALVPGLIAMLLVTYAFRSVGTRH